MDEMNKTNSDPQNTAPQLAFWGTITMAVVLSAVFVYAFLFIENTTTISYITRAGFLLAVILNAAGIAVTVRNRQELGLKLIYYPILMIGVMVAATVQGRALTISIVLLTIFGLGYRWVFPKASIREYTIASAITFVSVWLIEWINPVWRQASQLAQAGLIGAVLLVLVFVVLLIVQAQNRINSHIRLKVLTSSISITLILVFGMGAYVVIRTVNYNQDAATSDLLHTKFAVDASANSLESLAIGLSTQMANSPQVQEAFANRDRETLTQITLGTFDTLKSEFNVKQYQFILPNSTSFLRLHQLDSFGDDLSSFRFTVVEANRTQEAVSGLEIGRGGLGVRGESPVFYQGRYIGVIDVGLDIGEGFLADVKSRYSVDAQIMLDEEAAQTATFAGAVTETQSPIPGLLLQASTFSTPIFADANAYEKVLNGEDVISTLSSNGKIYAVISSPLRDHAGNIIGVLEIFEDRTAAAANETRNLFVLIIGSILVLAAGLVIQERVVSQTVKPVDVLTKAALELSKGNLQQQATVQSRDEFGTLANVFNEMANRIGELVANLEARVAARTHNLQLAAEVGRTVSQVRNLDDMLKDACDLILQEFDLYYVQVYLTNPSQTRLVLEAGTGDVGKQLLAKNHSLAFNINSINGRAAIEKRSVVITDTTKSAAFLKNPLLPETRGEMAVPLIVAGQVVGVLDMQSDKADLLTHEILPAFEALAGQMAVAVQNANLLAETEEARAQVESQARRLVRQGWDEHLDALHKPEKIGYVFDQNNVTPLDHIEMAETSEAAISAPITVTGEKLGSLVVELDNDLQTDQTSALIHVVASQVAQQIENLRLLESAERYRAEAEEASRRLTRESWKQYKQNDRHDLGYYYDLTEVRPLNSTISYEKATPVPITIRNEAIGQFVIEGLQENDTEALNLAKEVADRLGSHIENLRLLQESEETRTEIQESQERLAEALNIARLGNWEYDVNTDIFTFNDNFYAIFRTNVKEVGSYKLRSSEYAERFVHPEDAHIVGMEIGKTLNSTGRYYKAALEHRVIFADGTVGHISVNVNVERDENGTITRFYGANQDITERKKIEEELRARDIQITTALTETEKRAKQLAAVAEISTLSAQMQNTDEMLANVVHLTQRRFGLYHAHIFLYDEETSTLEVKACGWKEGDKHEGTHGVAIISINQEQSLVARAARSRKAVIVNDVHNEPGWLPNELLPDTASEMAIPLIIGDTILGVLDVQSDQKDAFTEEDANVQTTLASQVATSLQNARSFAKAQQQAERESMLNTINQKIQSATSVEAVLQIAARELGHALGAPMTVAQLNLKDKNNS